MNEKHLLTKDFFASANTYYGFRSYFADVFDSRRFDRIYVLKGGPGTGKSTLLKKIGNEALKMNTSLERFVCSSDLGSLDGVIIERENKRVALLDGTAPHERDAVLVGAVDVLVNLAEGIDINRIRERKDEIVELNDKKSHAYKKAYEKLQKSSIFYTNIKAEISNAFDFKACVTACETVFSGLDIGGESACGTRLLSSFSKCGRAFLNSTAQAVSHRIGVRGIYGSECIFLTMLSELLSEKGIPYVKIVSALDPTQTEGIYFTDNDTMIVADNTDGADIDTRELLPINEKRAFFDGIKALEVGMKLYEEESRYAFEEASKYHFELEKIYGGAIDFSVIDAKYGYLLESVSKIFL